MIYTFFIFINRLIDKCKFDNISTWFFYTGRRCWVESHKNIVNGKFTVDWTLVISYFTVNKPFFKASKHQLQPVAIQILFTDTFTVSIFTTYEFTIYLPNNFFPGVWHNQSCVVVLTDTFQHEPDQQWSPCLAAYLSAWLAESLLFKSNDFLNCQLEIFIIFRVTSKLRCYYQ